MLGASSAVVGPPGLVSSRSSAGARGSATIRQSDPRRWDIQRELSFSLVNCGQESTGREGDFSGHRPRRRDYGRAAWTVVPLVVVVNEGDGVDDKQRLILPASNPTIAAFMRSHTWFWEGNRPWASLRGGRGSVPFPSRREEEGREGSRQPRRGRGREAGAAPMGAVRCDDNYPRSQPVRARNLHPISSTL